jgi:TRAP-type C4-dicarboxylate transport system permease small subunit
MHSQRMTVFELPMSLVYGVVGLGCFMMLLRQIQVVWRNARDRWWHAPEVTEQIHAD